MTAPLSAKNKEKRIGLFVCHCGVNISSVVDVEKVAQVLKDYPGVTFSTDYVYMCSDPGQQMIIDTIKEKHLDGIIVAACSPTLHEKTFQEAARLAGLNPYQIEIANIREQDSWVHTDKEKATKKAIKIVKSHVAKARQNENLDPIKVDVTRRALVIGGGVSGLQAALDIADHGYEVILVEKNPSIGGKMIQLSETFPTLDCSQCILTPKMVEVSRHPRIKLLTYHEVESVSGFIGNFKVRIRKKPRYVDETLCNLCGECEKVCPQIVPDEFNQGLSFRKAIYMPFPQAIPGTFTLDEEHCLGLNPVRCGKCKDVCDKKAIDYDMKETIVEEEVGAIVVATGFDLYTMQALGEYGGEKYLDVVNGLEFERILSASGPTGGEVRRPSDGKVPKSIVFVQCSGSRDTEKHLPYCSKICCMYTAKHAMMYRHRSRTAKPPSSTSTSGRAERRSTSSTADGRGGQGPLHPRQGLQDLQRRRQAHRLGRRHPDREEGRGRSRYGRPGHGHGQGRRGPGPAEETQDRHRHPRLPGRGPSQAEARREPQRRILPGRVRPRPQGHPGNGRSGLGRGGQGRGPFRPEGAHPRADGRARQRRALLRLRHLPHDVPVHRPDTRPGPGGRRGERDPLRGLRGLRRRLSERRRPAAQPDR